MSALSRKDGVVAALSYLMDESPSRVRMYDAIARGMNQGFKSNCLTIDGEIQQARERDERDRQRVLQQVRERLGHGVHE